MSHYLSKEEMDNISTAFIEMGMEPPAQTAEEFRIWMEDKINEDEYGFKPTISTFYGNNKAGCRYDLWRYEVMCLVKQQHPDYVIKEAIRHSLHGDAIHIVKRLGPSATIDQITDKMDSIYASVEPKEAILGQFFTARQEQQEDVATWACRLEDILNTARQSWKVKEEDVNDMLASKLFEGLRPGLKNVGRYKKDTINDYAQLLKALRVLEQEHGLRPKKKKEAKLNPPPVQDKDVIEQLHARINQLTAQLKELQEKRDNQSNRKPYRYIQRGGRKQLYNHSINVIPDETILYKPTGTNRRNRDNRICWRCNQQGHIAVDCSVRLDHSQNMRRVINFQQAYSLEHPSSVTQKTTTPKGLLGSANEVDVTLNGIRTKALLDTGSTVSTMSEQFYNQYCSNTPIEPLMDFIRIECADGQPMPYLGYIEGTLEMKGIPQEHQLITGLFLIVPDSQYNREVPLLIGTNIMSEIMKDLRGNYGPRFLQEAKLYTPWFLAFRCITMRKKDLEKRHNKIGHCKISRTKSNHNPSQYGSSHPGISRQEADMSEHVCYDAFNSKFSYTRGS